MEPLLQAERHRNILRALFLLIGRVLVDAELEVLDQGLYDYMEKQRTNTWCCISPQSNLISPLREAFFNFLFHVVNDCSKRTGGRAASSKVKTQKPIFQQAQKRKRKRKKRASGEI